MLRNLSLAALVWLVVPLARVQAQVSSVRLESYPSNGSYAFSNGRFYRTNNAPPASRFYSYFPRYTPPTVFEAPLYVQVVPTSVYVQPSPPTGSVPPAVIPAPTYAQLAPTPVYVQPTPSSGFVPPTSSTVYVQPTP